MKNAAKSQCDFYIVLIAQNPGFFLHSVCVSHIYIHRCTHTLINVYIYGNMYTQVHRNIHAFTHALSLLFSMLHDSYLPQELLTIL